MAFFTFDSVFCTYLTSDTRPFRPMMVLMRIPLSLSTIVLPSTTRPCTVVDSSTALPPSEPMEMPWPPQQ
ncbi:hypothetical protein PF008_g31355 [Phytophthora fragariae]|uniref:Uncharacterized protein n=1 Tax=Phytophthora fragariae TaxID=53985 RepID=A0A6G0Q2X0_9STRA|nr:hypothetical protein PF008_g31355 [Phytophthora fragariae]